MVYLFYEFRLIRSLVLQVVQESSNSKVNLMLTSLGTDERLACNEIKGWAYFLTDYFNSTCLLAAAMTKVL